MTWSLAHESATLTASAQDTSDNPTVVFWDYFFTTFLPTKGWTTDKSDFNYTQTYYLCKKEFIQVNGLNMRWCFIWKPRWNSVGYTDLYVMPWVTSTADKTGYIHNETVNSNWMGNKPALLVGKHLQIWESDVHTDAFFIKTRETSAANGFTLTIHFPDLWHFGDPAFGTETNPDADVSVSPVWFTTLNQWSYQDYYDWDEAAFNCVVPEYHTYRMTQKGYLTNKLVIGDGSLHMLNGTADDILFRDPASGKLGNTAWQAIGYQGKNYIDVGYTTSPGYMLDVGQVDPQTGV